MYDTRRWAWEHLIVALCVSLRRQFTNPHGEERRFQAHRRPDMHPRILEEMGRGEKRAENTKVSKHGHVRGG